METWLIFIGFNLAPWLAVSRNVGFIKKRVSSPMIFHQEYYPQGYIAPTKMMKKVCRIKKKEIPRWLFRMWTMAWIHLLYVPVATVVLYIMIRVFHLNSKSGMDVLVYIWAMFSFFNIGYLLYWDNIWDNNKRKIW